MFFYSPIIILNNFTMKKFLFFASAALVLASCSSEAEEAVIKPNETPEEVLELTEIKLGGGAPTVSAETRAAVELNSWSDTPVGIFGVNENGAATDNDWSVAPARNQMNIAVEKAVILLNEPATVASDKKVKFTNPSDSKIYFPRGNNKNYGYTFLGYYPYLSTGVNAYADSITVTGKFDGTQDIMAGKATSATILTSNSIGYNAKYIRDYRVQYSGSEPTIDIPFSHLTTKISILLKQTSYYNPAMCDVHAAYFDVKKDYTLTFEKDASEKVKTTLEFSGDTVSAYAIGGAQFDETKNYKINDVVKYNNKYYTFTSAHTAGGWTGSDATVLPPVAPELSPSTEYTIFVTPDPQQNSGTATKTLHLVLNDDINDVKDITVTSPAGGFEAGKAYKVTVTINGPEEIKVTASITAWTDGGAVGDVEI